jgi:hypothetical protein
MDAEKNEREYKEALRPGEGKQFVEEGERKGSLGVKWCL